MRRVTFFLLSVAILVLVPRMAWAKKADIGQPMRLEVKGYSDAYYYKPAGRGLKPVLMYLHGRGGHPAEDCRKWARVARPFGWVVCPSGPEEGDNGGRAWGAGAGYAEKMLRDTVHALRDKYKGKVRLRGNILIGFSEGAFVAMQVGLKDQRTWDRWLILGASDQYWQYDISEPLDPKKRRVQRVYLLTGENDQVAEKTTAVGKMLRKAKVPVRVKIVPGLGHEVPSDRMITTYRRPLLWLAAAD